MLVVSKFNSQRPVSSHRNGIVSVIAWRIVLVRIVPVRKHAASGSTTVINGRSLTTAYRQENIDFRLPLAMATVSGTISGRISIFRFFLPFGKPGGLQPWRVS